MRLWIAVLLGILCISPCYAQSGSGGTGTISSSGTTTAFMGDKLDGPAILPRYAVDVTMPDTTGYTQATLCPSSCTYSDFQTMLTSIACKTIVTITPAIFASFSGFVLTNHGCDAAHQIVLKTSGTITASGARINPSYASQMVKLTSSGVGPNNILTVDCSSLGTSYYRLIGFEIAPLSANTAHDTTVLLGCSTENTLGQFANHIIVDRSWVHGLSYPFIHSHRGIYMGCTYCAVIHSYVENYEMGSDTQAAATWDSPGPVLLDDDFLEAGVENVFTGGPPSHIPGVVPCDWTVTNSFYYKRLAWDPYSYRYGGVAVGSDKNFHEEKNGCRTLLDGDVFYNAWLAGQNGPAFTLIPRCEAGGNCQTEIPWAMITDYTARNILVQNAGQIMQVAGVDNCDWTGSCDAGTGVAQYYRLRGRNFSFHDNLFQIISNQGWVNSSGFGVEIGTHGSPTDANPNGFSYKHNTSFPDAELINWDAPGDGNLSQTAKGIAFTDNLWGASLHNFSCNNCAADMKGMLTLLDPAATFSGNVMENVGLPGYNSSNFPTSNQTCGGSTTCFPTTLAGLGMVNSKLCTGWDDAVPNSGTGTGSYLLAKIVSSQATTVLHTDSASLTVAICTAGCGASGTPKMVYAGQAICIFDGAPTSGHGFTISPTVDGQCHDTGAAYNENTDLGIVQNSNLGGNEYGVFFTVGNTTFDPANCALTGASNYHNASSNGADFGANVDGNLATWQAAGPHLWSVDSVAPTSGTHLGGTSVLIAARHLNNINGSFPTVTIGGVTCTNVKYLDAEDLVCTTGAHAAGAADVVITDNSETATLAGGYTYN